MRLAALALPLCLTLAHPGSTSAAGEHPVLRAWRLDRDAFDLYRKGEHSAAIANWHRALAVYRAELPPHDPAVGALVNNLGAALRDSGRHEEARRLLEEAAFLRRKAPGAPDLADSLLNLGMVLRDLGRFEAAAVPLGEALGLYRAALPRRHPRLDDTHTNLGLVLLELCRFDAARSHLEEALAARRAARPANPAAVALGLNNLGVALRGLGRREGARDLFFEADALQREALPARHPDRSITLINLGIAAFDARRHDEARRHMEEALAIRRAARPARPAEVAETLYHLAAVLRSQGRWEAARRHSAESLAIRRAALPRNHPDVAASLGHLGIVLLALDDTEGALRHLGDALAVARAALPPAHPEVCRAWNNLGVVVAQLGRRQEALRHFEEAAGDLRDPGFADPEHLATYRMNLGLIERGRGRADVALRHLQEAVALFRKAPGPLYHQTADALFNLARSFDDLGRNREALALDREALALLQKGLPANHPAQVGSLAAIGLGLAELGQVAEGRRQLEEAVRCGRAALPALHSDLVGPLYTLSRVNAHEGVAAAAWWHGDEAAALATAYQWQYLLSSPGHAHPGSVATTRPIRDTLLQQLERTGGPAPGQCEGVMNHVLRLKGLSAAALRARHEAALLGADAEGRERLEELRQVRRQLAGLLLATPQGPEPEEVRRRADGLRLEQDRLEAALAGRVRGYTELRRADGDDAARVAGRLAAGEVLVECCAYVAAYPGKKFGGRRYGAFLLWRGGGGPEIRFVPLGAAAPLERAARAWRAAVQRGGRDAEQEAALRRLLWAPLARQLPAGASRLVVAPEGELALLPLEALALEKGEYLIERYAVRYVTSGRDLLGPGPAAGAGLRAVLLGDPDYDAPPAGGGAARTGQTFARLPGFPREIEAAARALLSRPGWEVAVRAGREASEEALSKVSRPRLLYLVTHGFFLEDVRPAAGAGGLRELQLVSAGGAARVPWPAAGEDPRVRSGLALAGANQWQERSAKGLSDGLLTALEVENLDLWGTELVVLSACETGRGEIQVGEGVLGLRRAFQLAGAQTVLASLWKVPDAETERLMTDTLARWLKGAPPHEALREAQLALIRHLRQSGARNGKQGEAPPLYWAGFVCHGAAGR